jgi:hypothetical protein
MTVEADLDAILTDNADVTVLHFDIFADENLRLRHS